MFHFKHNSSINGAQESLCGLMLLPRMRKNMIVHSTLVQYNQLAETCHFSCSNWDDISLSIVRTLNSMDKKTGTLLT